MAAEAPRPSHDPDTIAYWLEMWCATYAWLERSAPDDALFVCYEDLCTDPGIWRRIAEIAAIPTAQEQQHDFRLSERKTDAAPDSQLAEQASAIYGRLADRARAAVRKS